MGHDGPFREWYTQTEIDEYIHVVLPLIYVICNVITDLLIQMGHTYFIMHISWSTLTWYWVLRSRVQARYILSLSGMGPSWPPRFIWWNNIGFLSIYCVDVFNRVDLYLPFLLQDVHLYIFSVVIQADRKPYWWPLNFNRMHGVKVI